MQVRIARAALAVALLGGGAAQHVTASAESRPADPTRPGPHRVTRVDYDAGMTVLGPEAHTGSRALQPMPARLAGSLHLPSAPGRRPVVLLQHGRHGTCRYGAVELFGHPCPDTPATADVRSYTGYDYLGQNLASHGYIVMSVDANGVNSYDLADLTAGAVARAQLISRSLDLLTRWDRGPGPGAVGGSLVGRVDLGRLGMMGHSRGGEGVTYWLEYNRTRTDGPRYHPSAVFSLAPIDATDQTVFDVPFATLLPMCDGDVYTLEGAAVFERSKYADHGARAARFQFAVEGANHNFFNTVWTGDDYFGTDVACSTREESPARLSDAAQRRLGLAVMGAFLRRYVGGERRFEPLLTGAAPWSPACSRGHAVRCADLIRASYIPPAARRTVLIRPHDDDVVSSDQGMPIQVRNLDTFQYCDHSYTGSGCPQPATPRAANRSRGKQVTVEWSRPSSVSVAVRRGTAVGATHVVLRAGVNFNDGRNPESDGVDPRSGQQDFDVVVTDQAGRTARQPAGRWGPALNVALGSEVRNLVLSDIRIPLSAFAGVEAGRVATITLRFGARGPRTGSIQLADLSLQRL
ncbi:MAG TPA: hypothetical protein VNA12_10085 [Mycobacteriales bacterium]|nr:hypothetical protein [Mycobacteriales bacterium]